MSILATVRDLYNGVRGVARQATVKGVGDGLMDADEMTYVQTRAVVSRAIRDELGELSESFAKLAPPAADDPPAIEAQGHAALPAPKRSRKR